MNWVTASVVLAGLVAVGVRMKFILAGLLVISGCIEGPTNKDKPYVSMLCKENVGCHVTRWRFKTKDSCEIFIDKLNKATPGNTDIGRVCVIY